VRRREPGQQPQGLHEPRVRRAGTRGRAARGTSAPAAAGRPPGLSRAQAGRLPLAPPRRPRRAHPRRTGRGACLRAATAWASARAARGREAEPSRRLCAWPPPCRVHARDQGRSPAGPSRAVSVAPRQGLREPRELKPRPSPGAGNGRCCSSPSLRK
jgi:hypothetical protein